LRKGKRAPKNSGAVTWTAPDYTSAQIQMNVTLRNVACERYLRLALRAA
jgi:hypothetical protein